MQNFLPGVCGVWVVLCVGFGGLAGVALAGGVSEKHAKKQAAAQPSPAVEKHLRELAERARVRAWAAEFLAKPNPTLSPAEDAEVLRVLAALNADEFRVRQGASLRLVELVKANSGVRIRLRELLAQGGLSKEAEYRIQNVARNTGTELDAKHVILLMEDRLRESSQAKVLVAIEQRLHHQRTEADVAFEEMMFEALNRPDPKPAIDERELGPGPGGFRGPGLRGAFNDLRSERLAKLQAVASHYEKLLALAVGVPARRSVENGSVVLRSQVDEGDLVFRLRDYGGYDIFWDSARPEERWVTLSAADVVPEGTVDRMRVDYRDYPEEKFRLALRRETYNNRSERVEDFLLTVPGYAGEFHESVFTLSDYLD